MKRFLAGVVVVSVVLLLASYYVFRTFWQPWQGNHIGWTVVAVGIAAVGLRLAAARRADLIPASRVATALLACALLMVLALYATAGIWTGI